MTFDAIVVGGGIIGCTNAFYLARKGLRVAIVESGTIGCGTTSNSFAWINATTKVSDENYHRLNALGHATYCKLAVEFGEDVMGLYPTGALELVSPSDPSAYAAVKERARLLEGLDYPLGWIGTKEIRTLEPHLVVPDDAEALYTMSDPCLDAPKFARFMADQVRALGGEVLENCPAQKLEATDEGVVTGLETGRGVLNSPRVLVTVGPGTPEVLSEITGYEGFASRFPMRRVPGLLVVTPSTLPHKMVRHVLYVSTGAEFHVLPTPDGGLKFGADDTDGMVSDDPSPETVRRAALMLLKRAQQVIPGFSGEACMDDCDLRIGVRPYPEDGMTLAGQMPGSEGLFVIATHSGVTLAPALGSLMSHVIADGHVPASLEPFALERFQAFG